MTRIAVILAILVCIVAILPMSFARTARIEGAEVTLLEVGDMAPEFKLFGVDYTYHSLERYADKPVIVVVFHCNHCPTSQANVDRLVALGNEYQEKGVQFLVINPNPADKVAADGFPQMAHRARDKDFPFPYLYDETQMTAAAYGARRTDHVFVLCEPKEDGRRPILYIGPIDDRHNEPVYLAQALDARLAGEEIENKEIDAFGCTIKYRTASERVARFGYDPLD